MKVRATHLMLAACGLACWTLAQGQEQTLAQGQELRDTMPDTWVATDDLGRVLPGFAECGPRRADRTVAMFYFLWLGPHAQGGPYDISKILAEDPAAMSKPDSPLWGPLGSPHHWGESIFGYYNSDDPYVLAKHAQLLGDAGVDLVVFDVTNQHTYTDNAKALLNVFAEVRERGARTPQVAFLCPFWTPAAVVRKLAEDIYEPRFHEELWFRWDGKPLILADPSKLNGGVTFNTSDVAVRLEPGHTLGQRFATTQPLTGVEIRVPTWQSQGSSLTLTLRRDGEGQPPLEQRAYAEISDNAWVGFQLEPALPPGRYVIEVSRPQGTIGWWSSDADQLEMGEALFDGQGVAGDRSLRLTFHDSEANRLRDLFAFRSPQPDYFQGPTKPDMWSWLEVFPQHVYRNSRGESEQMSVGVAQNAVDGRLGSMSEPGAQGRSFHRGAADPDPQGVALGLNFAEQFERALAEDPRLIFVTGWNEWIAGLHHEFNGVRQPVMFVDQFDQEHSRDIEPMKGGHGDAYYLQLVSFIRRYKGVGLLPPASPPRPVRINRDFTQWTGVEPVYLDDAGDTRHRDWPGYNHHTQYRNDTGRNDIVLSQVARDGEQVSFHVQTHAPLSAPQGEAWMLLYIDTDGRHDTGWQGYDLLVNRRRLDNGCCTIEENAGGWNWREVGQAPLAFDGRDLHLAVPQSLLDRGGKVAFDFTWADNIQPGDVMSFYTDGDTAPNGRFAYRYRASRDDVPSAP
jgi:hypothetical protein